MCYNINKHPHFNEVKDYLCNFVSCNFEDFLKEMQDCANIISNSISETNYSVCGFDYFDKRWYPNNLNALRININNKVIGDIFEMFIGFFVQYFETGQVFSIRRSTYEFGNDLNDDVNETDLGMDGWGIFSSTNENAVIQVKYRSNPKDRPFTKEVFASLFSDAIIKEKIMYGNQNQRMIFFTNIPLGKKDSWDGKTNVFNYLVKESKTPVILIGKNEISCLVGSKKDNTTNTNFWKTFYSQFI